MSTKEVIVWIVPNDDPNAESIDLYQFMDDDEIKKLTAKWSDACEILEKYIPEGYFLVKYKVNKSNDSNEGE